MIAEQNRIAKNRGTRSRDPEVVARSSRNYLGISRDEVIHGGTYVNQNNGQEKPFPGLSKVPKKYHDEVLWLFDYGLRTGSTCKDLARVIGMHESNPIRILRGSYTGSWETIAKHIGQARDSEQKADLLINNRFVMTSISKEIWQAIDYAKTSTRIVILVGESYLGKTTALKEYIRTDRYGFGKYQRTPPGLSYKAMLNYFTKAIGTRSTKEVGSLHDNILAALNHQNYLLIDEFHRNLQAGTNKTKMDKIDFFRDVKDICKCGLVLTITPVFRREIEDGRFEKFFGQFRERAYYVHLPAQAPMGDFLALAGSRGLKDPDKEAQEVIKQIRSEDSLGKFVADLDDAATMAANQKRDIEWDDLLDIHALRLKNESYKRRDSK